MKRKEMDSITMAKILRKDKQTRRLFRGVYSRNNLPSKRSEGLYIVNEEPSHKKGSHWIAFHITPGNSYGRKPLLQEFQSFMGKNIQYNNKQLQHMLSTSCGQWCMYFIWRRSSGWKLRNITEPFCHSKTAGE